MKNGKECYLTGEPVIKDVPVIDLNNSESTLILSDLIKFVKHCFYGDDPINASLAIKVLGKNKKYTTLIL